MVSLEWAFGPATPFTLTARSTVNGFGGLSPHLSLQKVVVSHTIFMPVGLKATRSR